MFSAIRKRFTYANVAMTLALVFAMTGGAYAAKHYLITSTKQISPKVLRQLKGKTGKTGVAGANGANGTNGAQGAAGANGKDGANGANGKDGVSVASSAEPAGTNCTAGGSKLVAANGTTYACNGKSGTFSSEPLPPKQTLTGVWSTGSGTPIENVTITKEEVGGKQVVTEVTPVAGVLQASISFPIKVHAAPVTVVQYAAGVKLGIEVENEKWSLYNPSGAGHEEEDWEKACPGTAEEPAAGEGFLCVYVKTGGAGAFLIAAPASTVEAAQEFGVVLPFELSGTGVYPRGTWAVTAE